MNASSFRRLHTSIQSAIQRRGSDDDLLRSLIQILRRVSPDRFASGISKRMVERDVAAVVAQVRETLQGEPIPRGVKTLYFGLFDAMFEGSDAVVAGFYISGVKRFDSTDPDTLCRPAYFPENRYLRSELLDYVSVFAQKARLSDHREAIAYGGMLAMSAYLVRRVDREVGFGRQLVTGFDDGDFVLVQ